MSERRFMELALEEASLARGRTSPNPAVGAVMVRRGRVIAAGHTAPAGGPHAEVVALARAGRKAKGATLYTTLEPCCHAGRTGPCTDSLIAAGVARVVVGTRDRNPRVAGRGIRQLRRAGIVVDVGLLEEECLESHRAFFTWVTLGRPHVVLKAAATLDGRIATESGDSRWVTGRGARARVHQWRQDADAILVGAGTVRADDPRLTSRGGGERLDPVRVVLDGRLSTDPGARVYRQRSRAPTWLAVPRRTRTTRLAPYQGPRVEVLRLPGRSGRVELPALLDELARRGIVSLLVEGGADVHGQFLASGLFDEVRLFLAPKVVGAGLAWVGLPDGRAPERMREAFALDDLRVEPVDSDLLLLARPARR